MYYEHNLLAYFIQKNGSFLFDKLFWKNRQRLIHELTTIRIDKFKVYPKNDLSIHTDSYKERDFCEYPVCDIV